MKVTVVSIDQSYELSTGAVENYAILELPSGKRLRIAVSDEDTTSLISESTNELGGEPESWEIEELSRLPTPQERQLAKSDVVHPGPHVAEVASDSAPVIEWEKLPESQLSSQMKNILRRSDVNKFISPDDLATLIAQMSEVLDKQPKAGKVNWNEGPKHPDTKNPWANLRTTPKEPLMSSVPPGGIVESAPIEETDDDDDGVGQL